ncbi:hypothetical protein NS183_13625 [Microbacterium testaceum]|uniref:SpaA isopeptide-forming pilin-related protein n=1 Tax=Microbacterium testaceum TaxID=2033 RepID=UPI000734CB41|nr:SpaA isopeptide-forming pilin-related protein [Microbacterium testaceum]KTS84948.1 hypothetical protein NS183_13625 [Microbacterium testaceum]
MPISRASEELTISPLSIPVTQSANLDCSADVVYNISLEGQLRKTTRTATTSTTVNVGTRAGAGTSANSFNALAIAPGGTIAYALFTSTGTVYYFDGTWHASTDKMDRSAVGGTVDPITGEYYLLTSVNSGAQYQIRSYTPSTGAFVYRGYVSAPSSSYGNGDFAFDSAGNLMIVLSTNGGTTQLYSISRANLLANSSQGQFTYSSTNASNSGLNAVVNGIAFNGDGTVFLGGQYNVRAYDYASQQSFGPTSPIDYSGNGGTSTDLASCASPATLTVQKDVVARVASGSSDQFVLTAAYSPQTGGSSSQIGSQTTSGTATGIQSNQLGPIPVKTGSTVTIGETMASGSPTPLTQYASTTRCVDQNNNVIPVTSSGNLTIPSTSSTAVTCVIRNAPLAASVTVTKSVQDVNGQNAQPAANWTLGATTTATTGTATQTPAATSQTTTATGQVSWSVAFNASTSRATVRVSETQQTGYQFVSGSCTVTSLDGSVRTITLTGAAQADVTGVAPADRVACAYVNKPVPATTLTLRKVLDNTTGGTSVLNDWTLSATGPTPITGKTNATSVTNAPITAGTYTLSESGGPAGYTASAWSCNGATASGSTVTIPAGTNVTCTITNTSRAGTVTWRKTSQDGTTLLGKSEWTISGPGFTAPNNVVVDCVVAPCQGRDLDPAPGAFRLENLAWGSYNAVETKAPAGFVADRTFAFTVTGSTAGTVVDLGAQRNSQQSVPVLPLTGGLGEHLFLFGGGGLLAIALTLLVGVRVRRSRRRVG